MESLVLQVTATVHEKKREDSFHQNAKSADLNYLANKQQPDKQLKL